MELKILLLFLFVGFSMIYSADNEKKENLQSYLEFCGKHQLINGSYLAAENDNIVIKKGLGKADLTWDIENSPNTKFQIGSISKQFNAAVILSLAQEGKIDIEKPIKEYLPDYRVDTGSKIKISHLLSNSSGLTDYADIPGVWHKELKKTFTHDEFYKKYCMPDLDFEPGEKFQYSNTGFFLLALIAEKIEGKTYHEILKERIFAPLNMEDSGILYNEKIIPKMASGYMYNGHELINEPYIYFPNLFGACDMYSTVEDMFKWYRGVSEDKILKEEYKKKMFSKHVKMGENSWYGFGVEIHNVNGIETYQHPGGVNGFQTHFIMTEDKMSVLFFNVRMSPVRHNQEMFKILCGLDYVFPKIPVRLPFLKDFNEKDFDYAWSNFSDKFKERDRYDFSELQINFLGYQIMFLGEPEKALKIFRFNADLFPESSNVYDSLGECLYTLGKKKESLKFYEKVIEINPENINAEKMIKKIKDEL